MAPEPVLRPIGWVESPVTDPSVASRQGDEGAPDCWLVFDPDVRPALDGLKPGDDIDVLTWLYLADRTVLRVHPRGDTTWPMRGVFATRSQHRPNGLLFARAPVYSTRRAHGHGLDLIVCDVDGGGAAAPRRAVAKVLCTRNADPGGPAGRKLHPRCRKGFAASTFRRDAARLHGREVSRQHPHPALAP